MHNFVSTTSRSTRFVQQLIYYLLANLSMAKLGVIFVTVA